MGIRINYAEGFGQRLGLGKGLVTMPVAVRPLPENAPDLQTGQVPDLGDWLFNLLAGTIEGGAHDEEFNGPIGETLSLADLIPQMQRGTAARPEGLFNYLQVLGHFVFSKGHVIIFD